MPKSLLFISTVLVLFQVVFSNTGDLARQSVPTPGPSQQWDKIPEVRSIRTLEKPTSGDTTFFIRENIYETPVNLIGISFSKKFENSDIVIYVETKEFVNGHVTAEDVDRVVDAMIRHTPDGSVNPDMGILPNEEQIFGQTPDVDKNGKLFVLLVDVRDGYVDGTSETYVAGYFDPLDQTNSESKKGNFADIIYVDTNPAKTGDLATLSTVAHELQHLIHFRYDRSEATWLNEGLSELAPRLLGLPARSFALFLNDTDRPLNHFDDSLTDYSKVALWSFYMARRFGLDMIGAVTHDGTRHSLDSYLYYLNAHGYPTLTTEDLLTDWFLANLLNDSSIDDGRYGYGVEIPTVTSGYFSSNFTDGKTISENLHFAAAEYIQFYSGKDIRFNMTHDPDDQLHMAVVKHTAVPEIEIVDLNGTDFQYADPDFGYGYEKISFIPFSTSLLSQDDPAAFSFSAEGVGGTIETEVAFDGDSTSFYIYLNGAEAAERFMMSSSDFQVKGIRFHVGSESPVTVRLYASASSSFLAEWTNITPAADALTRFDFDDVQIPDDATTFILSVSSADSEQTLGYSHTKAGTGRALWKESGSVFRNLSFYTVNGELLTGDWNIRAIVSEQLNLPPKISIEPDSLYLWENEYSGSFAIRNGGTQALEWEIAADLPAWLTIEPIEGVVTTSRQMVDITIDRNILPPGINEFTTPIQSNGGADTLYLSILQRNYKQSQAAILPIATDFSDQVGRLQMVLFNIGIDESAFAFLSDSRALVFHPESGVIPKNDTLKVDVFVDRDRIKDRELYFDFYNGIDTIQMKINYTGTIINKPPELAILSTIPNPFITEKGLTVAISTSLPLAKPASLKIYNIIGQEIRSFSVNNPNSFHVMFWDGKNEHGEWVSAGVYLMVLEQKGKTARRKMVILR